MFAASDASGNGAQESLHDMNVVGRGATATTNQAHTDIDESSGIFRHVLGRAEINISPFHRARHAGIGLRRERGRSHGAHAFKCVQHGHRPDAAIASHDVGAPSFDLRSVVLGGGPVQAVAVLVDGDLCHHRQLGIHIASGKDGLMQLFQIPEGFQDNQIDSFFVQGRNLLAKGIAGLGKRDFPQGLNAHAQGSNGAGNQRIKTLGRLPCHPGTFPVDVS